MRSKIFLYLVIVAIITLGFISVGFAYDVQVEIIPLGDYPDTALPPGEAFSNIYSTNNWINDKYKASLEARANSGWIFVGWEFDDSFYAIHQKPKVFEVYDQDLEAKVWTTNTFELLDTITAKAVFVYVGPGSEYYELTKMNPTLVESPNRDEIYAIEVYERDPLSVDGDYGTIFCYPNDFNYVLTIPAVSISDDAQQGSSQASSSDDAQQGSSQASSNDDAQQGSSQASSNDDAQQGSSQASSNDDAQQGFTHNFNTPAGSTIMLVALPKEGFKFSHWVIFKKGQNGYTTSTSNVLILNVDDDYSIDAIYIPDV